MSYFFSAAALKNTNINIIFTCHNAKIGTHQQLVVVVGVCYGTGVVLSLVNIIYCIK